MPSDDLKRTIPFGCVACYCICLPAVLVPVSSDYCTHIPVVAFRQKGFSGVVVPDVFYCPIPDVSACSCFGGVVVPVSYIVRTVARAGAHLPTFPARATHTSWRSPTSKVVVWNPLARVLSKWGPWFRSWLPRTEKLSIKLAGAPHTRSLSSVSSTSLERRISCHVLPLLRIAREPVYLSVKLVRATEEERNVRCNHFF